MPVAVAIALAAVLFLAAVAVVVYGAWLSRDTRRRDTEFTDV